MSQARRIPRHFILSSNQNGAAAPDEESHIRLLAIPDTTEQMEFNISSATQVGHQLAVIGDEFNSTYTTRKLQDMLFHLAQGMAVSVFQTCIWSIFKGVIKSFRSLLNNGWTKRVVAYGSWIPRLPLTSMCQKLMPAALFVILLWWTVSYGLQN
ncbi:bcl-2-interacting killer-like isoform X2 [Emydura macquarii macquarii]|uniref:bcl-2-interacting killer-like isoform X2 n=1 Tax=Emydura macquarii macquarii TaxID=1129001 RepID=UPI00352BBFFA